jgi:light-harvesting protein B-800-850 alpha chain
MIYGKIWLVVKPSVGIPLFLGAVAVGSFAVHVAMLTTTTWLPKYYNGSAAVKAAATEVQVDTAAAAPSVLTATAATAAVRQ